MTEEQAKELLKALRFAAEQAKRSFEYAVANHGQPDWHCLAGTFEVLENAIRKLEAA